MPPPAESSLNSGRMLTEYQAKFFAHSVMAIQASKKPKNRCQFLEGKMADMTIFRSDCVSHKVTQKPPKVTKAYVPPEGSMKHTSTYVHDYHAHSLPQKIVIQPVAYNPPSVKMDMQSTYKEEFRSWDTPIQQPLRTSINPKLSHATINMNTNSQDDHCSRNPAATQKSFKANPTNRESPSFESMTSYRLQYVPHPVQPRQPKQRAPHQPNSTAFSGVTTHRHDYQCLQWKVTKPIRSKATWESNPTPFKWCTEFQDKYKTWPMMPQNQHRTVKRPPPRRETEFICTTQQNFQGHLTQPLPSMQPSRQVLARDKVPAKNCSTMKAYNRILEGKRGVLVVWPKDTDNPVGAFANGSTFSTQNTLKATVQPTSVKPTQRVMSLCSMQDNSLPHQLRH
ncbi:stabilizer of axonemal microtubules 1-like [Megalops cyprinoides]|uniref:stabilizer of axonemal microtubules 1-like n=1 Tax=Megalops cyprinoides TaxID=118141 RepID=UPI001863EFE6|nr:stabilizer of axonemal microtubules 1-like [Megalops cyprinoides]